MIVGLQPVDDQAVSWRIQQLAGPGLHTFDIPELEDPDQLHELGKLVG